MVSQWDLHAAYTMMEEERNRRMQAEIAAYRSRKEAEWAIDQLLSDVERERKISFATAASASFRKDQSPLAEVCSRLQIESLYPKVILPKLF